VLATDLRAPSGRTPALLLVAHATGRINMIHEPHVVDVGRVNASTTPQAGQGVRRPGAECQPARARTAMAGTVVISPGHTVRWR